MVCKIGPVRFSSDFVRMLRTNLASKRCTELRLQGELPFTVAGQEPKVEVKLEAIAPCDLERGDFKVPLGVRKAWGQGVCDGFRQSGSFEFSVEASEKESFGEMLSWHMASNGIEPQFLDNRCLTFTSSKGEEARGNKQEIAKLMADPKSYPVRVSYKPHPAFRLIVHQHVVTQEIARTCLKYTKKAVEELGWEINNVKHKHQRRTFERYLLYIEDHHYQTEDDLSDAMWMEDVVEIYPESGGFFLLINKTAPGLPKILRGEIDVLEYLFGG